MTSTPTIFPAAIYLLGALVIPFLKGNVRKFFMVVVALVGLINILYITPQTSWQYSFLGLELIFLQADKLSLLVGYILGLIGFLGVIYTLRAKEKGLHIAAFVYMGGGLGVTFAGDFFTLYVFWEIMAIASTVVIWSKQEKKTTEVGFRYLIMHLTGGVIFLAGILLHYAATGSIEVTGVTAGLPMLLFFIGIGLNAGFIPLHTWLPDAYPTAPYTGSIFLSVFTTKTAVYLLARSLSGWEMVAYMGAIMSVYGVSFALMQNNARKLLSYHIISQVGYMVAAIGIGGAMGINGGIFHLLNNVLYKTLLFMGIGAVMYRTGIEELTKLGGLTKKMPITTATVCIAALSISGMTFFAGYGSKGMIFEAAHGNDFVYIMLELAAVGTALSFLKLTYFGFLRKNDKIEAKEAPLCMLIPMIVVAFFCVLLGVYPEILLDYFPYPVSADFHFYSWGHILGVWELLGVTAIIFFVVRKYYSPHDRVTRDFDYFYLKGMEGLAALLRDAIGFVNIIVGWGINCFLKVVNGLATVLGVGVKLVSALLVWPTNNIVHNERLRRTVSWSFKVTDAIVACILEDIPNLLICISKNPVASLKITSDSLLQLVSSPQRRAEIQERINREKAIYPGDIIKHWPIGATVLWVTLFLLAYLLLYYL